MSPLEIAVLQERIRQARYSFNLALISTAGFALVGLTGFGLLFANKLSEGAFTTLGGSTLSVYSLRLAKDANDRLDKLAQELID